MKNKRHWLCALCLLMCLCAGAAAAEPAWVKTQKGALNMRRRANSKSDIVVKVPNGSEVELLERGETWSKVQYRKKTGYVQTAFLVDEAPEEKKAPVREVMVLQSGGFARIATERGSLNIRKKPDGKSTVIGQAKSGARVAVVEATLDWTRIEHGGKQGYVQTQYLALDSQLIGTAVYPDGDYLYIHAQADELSPSLYAVTASQPLTLLGFEGDWVFAACSDGTDTPVRGYVRMADIAAWRTAPGRAAQSPASVSLDLSTQTLVLGDVLRVAANHDADASCTVRVRRDGKTVMDSRPLTHDSFSYRPRKEGVYQMELVARSADGTSIGYEARFIVEPGEAEAEVPAVYSQKDGWWLDKKYSRSNLDQSGCAIFTLSHALEQLGKGSEKTRPDALARTYPMYLAESGTVTANLLAAASRDFGFKTGKDKISQAEEIAQGLQSGCVYSFAIVSGHIALACGLSEDGTKVRIVDSAPSATWERIENARLYISDGQGAWQAVSSLEEIPGAAYYIETDQYGGLTYYLDLAYVAGRGARPIQP